MAFALCRYGGPIAMKYDTNNLIHTIGYSLERVHTGILARYLERREDSNLDEQQEAFRRDLLALLFSLPREEIAGHDFDWTWTAREEKLGKRRLDLCVWCTSDEKLQEWKHLLALEAKVDSPVRPKQLDDEAKGARAAAKGEKGKPQVSHALLVLGASRFTLELSAEAQESKWKEVGPSDLLEVLGRPSHSDLLSRDLLLADWKEALLQEIDLESTGSWYCMKECDRERAEETRKIGNASWFYPFDNFRRHFHAQEEGRNGISATWKRRSDSWWIYFAGREPIMNFKGEPSDGWLPFKAQTGLKGRFFLEFNRGDLVLKLHHPAMNAEEIREIKVRLADHFQGTGTDGKPDPVPTRFRTSKLGYASLLKWPKFLPESSSPDDSKWVERVDNFNSIYSKLKRWASVKPLTVS